MRVLRSHGGVDENEIADAALDDLIDFVDVAQTVFLPALVRPGSGDADAALDEKLLTEAGIQLFGEWTPERLERFLTDLDHVRDRMEGFAEVLDDLDDDDDDEQDEDLDDDF